MSYTKEQMREYMRERRAKEKADRPPDWKDGRVKYDTPEDAKEAKMKSIRKSVKKWIKNNPKKARAQWRLDSAVKRGTIARPKKCSECGKPCNPDGHHPDYSKPLDVIWLCKLCHKKLHAKLNRQNVKGE